jgi:hypothetical protein
MVAWSCAQRHAKEKGKELVTVGVKHHYTWACIKINTSYVRHKLYYQISMSVMVTGSNKYYELCMALSQGLASQELVETCDAFG